MHFKFTVKPAGHHILGEISIMPPLGLDKSDMQCSRDYVARETLPGFNDGIYPLPTLFFSVTLKHVSFLRFI